MYLPATMTPTEFVGVDETRIESPDKSSFGFEQISIVLFLGTVRL